MTGAAKTLDEIAAWRATCPDITLRSTFIVGYPGETEDDHSALLEFVEAAQLDWGGFATLIGSEQAADLLNTTTVAALGPVTQAAAAALGFVATRNLWVAVVFAALLGWIAGELIATDPAVHPWMRAFDSPLGPQLDALLASIGVAPRFAASGSVGEHLFALLGVVVVLIAGTIWRRSQMRVERPAE